MSLIFNLQPSQHIGSASFLRRNVDGFFDLFKTKAMRRLDYHQLAVKLTDRDLLQLNLLLHKWMDEGLDGELRTSYVARTPYTSVEKETLRQILEDKQLPGTIHNLEIKFEDGRRSVEVNFSSTAVITRVIGGADDEYWEECRQSQLTKFFREKKAKFLWLILSPVPFLVGGGIYTLAALPESINIRTFLFCLAYIATSFITAGLCWLHQKGIGFPHAQIMLRSDDTKTSNSASTIISTLNLIFQFVKMYLDYFYSVIALPYKLWCKRLQ